jgi:hypothetical protein
MAPTKAIATYAITTLILPTKGPSKVIEISLVHVTARSTPKVAKRSRRKKSAVLHYRHLSTAWPRGNVVKEV